MNVLIFGGSGFIGGHLSRRLLSLGHHVTVFDLKKPRILGANVYRPDAGEASWFNPLRFVGGDIADYQQVYFAVNRGDLVVNLAAVAQFSAAEQQPHVAVSVNVTGAVNVMQACIENKAEHLVYTSTGSVYSKSSTVPIDENQPLCPGSMYGMTKLWAETALYHYVEKMPTTVLRLPHIVGPGKTWGANSMILKLLANERPVIFGDGFHMSDFTYVGDIVQAIELALIKKATGVYNIGSGKCNSTVDFFKAARRACDRLHIEPLYASLRDVDFPIFEYNISKARKELGYVPAYDLESTLSKTVMEWNQWL